MDIQLRPFQDESIEALRENIRQGVKNQILSAPTGSGKCHGAGTLVMLANGRRRAVEEVRVGDRLLGPDGQPRTVLALGRGRGMLYRVTPRKGEVYTCNEEHILSLKKTGPDGIRLPDGQHVARSQEVVHATVATLRSANRTARHCLKGWRAEAVEFPDARRVTLPIPPYVLGAWLGDGVSRLPAMSAPPCGMVNEWNAWCLSLGLTVREERAPGRCPVWHASGRKGHPNAAKDALRSIGVLNNKHIPHAYLTASVRDRLELLAGLIDADGHMSGGGYDWISCKRQLAHDFAFVARSLGFSCYVSPCEKKCTNNGVYGRYWRCSLSGDMERLPSRDKKAPARRQKKRHLVHGITIRPLKEDDYFGFVIDGDRQYLLGDFTVTHNTVLASYLLDECYHKGSKRAVFVCDRIPLVDQTSAMLDAYGIPHGVIQADHWRNRPWERIQVASAQTLARRQWPDAHLIIVDEAHGLNKSVTRRIGARDCVTIGLTATPFTKGLGKHYEKVVSVTTTNALIKDGWLAAYQIFAASEPDMSGAKVDRFGEWTEGESARRSMPIVGDCVVEYLKHGREKKFIAFGCTVAHCEEMQRQFMAAGVQCALYTYRTGDDERKRMVEEFRKPNSYIRGLISVSALAKGFDVSDVEVIVMARPLRKSMTEFIQMFGRGLRSHPGKEVCTLLDHSGNVLRFWDQMNDFFENGASELDDGRPKEKKKAKEAEKKPVKCPKCFRVHDPRPMCPHCGHVYPKRSGVSHVAGELRELAGGSSATPDQRQDIYSQLLYVQRDRGYKPGYAAAKFKTRFGTFPNHLREIEKVPSPALLRWIRSEAIAYARSKKR